MRAVQVLATLCILIALSGAGKVFILDSKRQKKLNTNLYELSPFNSERESIVRCASWWSNRWRLRDHHWRGTVSGVVANFGSHLWWLNYQSQLDLDGCPLHFVSYCDLLSIIYMYINCVDILYSGQRPNNLKIRVGSTRHASDGTIHTVKRIVQHQNFSYQTIDWDYSLLELDSDITLTRNAQPVKLPQQSQTVADKTECLVTGWGSTQV